MMLYRVLIRIHSRKSSNKAVIREGTARLRDTFCVVEEAISPYAASSSESEVARY